MQCHRCGREVHVGARFCEGCGQPVAAPKPGAPPRRSWTPVWTAGVLAGCLVVVLLGALVGAGIWYVLDSQGGLPRFGRAPAVQTPAPSRAPALGTPTPAQAKNLQELAGVWVLVAGQSSYDEEDPAANRAEFLVEGDRLVARPAESAGGEIRLLSRRGDDLAGEFAEGKTVRPLTGRVEGERLILTVEGESVTLVREEGASATSGSGKP